MNRNLIIVLIVLGGLIVVCGGAILFVMNLLQLPMYVDRTIGQNVQVTSEWTELTASSPMKIVRDFQSVELEVEGAYTSTQKVIRISICPTGLR